MTEERLEDGIERLLYAFGMAQQEVGRAYGRGDPDDDEKGNAESADLAQWQSFASTQRDQALAELRSALLAHVDALRARVEVTDAMVERAARVFYEISFGPHYPWDGNHHTQPTKGDYRDFARRALTAALGGGRELDRRPPTVTDEMVERAAVGMYDHDEGRVRNWNACHEETRYHYRSLARRALTAALGGDREGAERV